MLRIKLVLIAALLAVGCTPSLQTVANEPRTVNQSASVDDKSEFCERVSRAEELLRYVVTGSAALAGGSGLSVIPVDNRDAQTGLAISAAAFGVAAVTAESLRAEVNATWQRECE